MILRHDMTRRTNGTAAWTLAAGVAASCATATLGQMPVDQRPVEFEGAGVVDRRGELLPMDIELTDHNGVIAPIGKYFGDKPVILTLNYYRCPMLCTLMLNGLVDGLNDLDLEPGKDFSLLTLSFDPEEGTELASHKRRAYLTQYTKDGAADGWTFFTGTRPQIDALLDAAGVSVKFDQKSGEWVHTSTILFLTPDGRVSLYMDDVVFAARDLRLALVEASQGEIGSPLDQFALFTCFQYDPEANSYKVAAWKIMRSGGMLTLMLLVGGLGMLWLRELRRHAADAEMDLKRPAIGGAGGSH